MLRVRLDKLFNDALYIRQKELPQGMFLYVFLRNGLEFDVVASSYRGAAGAFGVVEDFDG